VNAAALALLREVEVQSKIRKIRAFGRSARVVCSALFSLSFVVGVLAMLVVLLAMISGHREPGSNNRELDDLMRAALTPLQFNVWAFCILSLVLSIWLGVLRQLERVFGSLAAGAIYTPENVRRVRNVGLLCLLWSSLDILIPAMILVGLRFIDAPGPIDVDRVLPSLSELFRVVVTPGLILLVSWIMDVGLYEKEHADVLRQEADLVI
jgi:hypothetical protein